MRKRSSLPATGSPTRPSSGSSSTVDNGSPLSKASSLAKSGRDTPIVSDTDSPDAEYRVGPGRPPKEYQFKPGQSGNPKGARRKSPSIALDLKALMQAALAKPVTLRQGEKERTVTMAAAGIEQLVSQFAQGNPKARRDLITLAGELGVELVPRQVLAEALAPNHQAIIEAYITRRQNDTASSQPAPVLAPPDLLDDDSDDPKSK